MNALQKEYKAQRKHYPAKFAIINARTVLEWAALGGDTFRAPFEEWKTGGCDSVRLRIELDECVSMEDLKGDCFNVAVNCPPCSPSQIRAEEKEFEERVACDGIWGVIGEYFDGSEWVHADSCWGFVGEDWRNSGYNVDIMRATLDALRDVTTEKSETRAAFDTVTDLTRQFIDDWEEHADDGEREDCKKCRAALAIVEEYINANL